MLVGRGVEDDLRPQPLEHRLQPVAITDVGEHELEVDRVGGRLGGDLVEVGLVVVEEDEQGRLVRGDLGGDLGPDRSTGTGDQDPAGRDRGQDAVAVGDDLLATEQVVDLQVADVADGRRDRSAARGPAAAP